MDGFRCVAREGKEPTLYRESEGLPERSACLVRKGDKLIKLRSSGRIVPALDMEPSRVDEREYQCGSLADLARMNECVLCVGERGVGKA